MSKITHVDAMEILDSRGVPTVETTIVLDDACVGVSSCPAGASIGSFEAWELRDRDEKRHQGMGVLRALEYIQNLIAPKLVGMDPSNLALVDKALLELDGTDNKNKLGANTTLSVSQACAKAAAKSMHMPLYIFLRQFIKSDGLPIKIPTPLFNMINGGKHAGMNLDFQEFLVAPATSKTYSEALEIGTNIHESLGKVLKTGNYHTLLGDEGGYAPKMQANLEALIMLKQAVDAISLRYGFDVYFGMDAAANSLYSKGKYTIKDKGMTYSPDELIAYYEALMSQFPLIYLEDPLFEDDFDAWTKIVNKLGNNTIIVGDDLTVTNPYRLQMALDKKAITGIIIKPNQIGTVIEAIAVVEIARSAGLKIIVSHRSGETTDDFIADFAVGVGADYVKFGAPARGERVAKYNRLLYIERELQVAK